MAIREGRWDCPSCGSKGQLGRHVYCTGCGAPRPKEIRFYLPEDAEAVTDASQMVQATAGADWVCEHCGGSARATDADCPGCGAPRGSSVERQVHEYDTADIPRAGGPPASVPRQAMQQPPSTRRPAKRSHFGRNVFLVLLIAV
ncbi:MAG TPA: hypothetical protein VF771_11850, partial [Longimicrobiaceae bacterium]